MKTYLKNKIEEIEKGCEKTIKNTLTNGKIQTLIVSCDVGGEVCKTCKAQLKLLTEIQAKFDDFVDKLESFIPDESSYWNEYRDNLLKEGDK